MMTQECNLKSVRHITRRHGLACAISSLPQVTKSDAITPTLEQEFGRQPKLVAAGE